MTNITFEQIIKDLRERGYKDADIARRAKCTRQYIGKIGNGEVQDVGYRIGDHLMALHKTLK